MNFIGKHISLIGMLLLTVFVGAAAALYFDRPTRWSTRTPERQRLKAPGALHAAHTPGSPTYTCPMHADVVSAMPGDCPKCGMALVSAREIEAGHHPCEDSGEHHPGCCADKSAAQPATQLRLPPGHPPVPGWTVDTNAAAASSDHQRYSSL